MVFGPLLGSGSYGRSDLTFHPMDFNIHGVWRVHVFEAPYQNR